MLNVNLIVFCFAVIIIGQAGVLKSENYMQEARTITYDERMLNDNNVFDEFDNHQIVYDDIGISITAEKIFNSNVLSNLDFGH